MSSDRPSAREREQQIADCRLPRHLKNLLLRMHRHGNWVTGEGICVSNETLTRELSLSMKLSNDGVPYGVRAVQRNIGALIALGILISEGPKLSTRRRHGRRVVLSARRGGIGADGKGRTNRFSINFDALPPPIAKDDPKIIPDSGQGRSRDREKDDPEITQSFLPYGRKIRPSVKAAAPPQRPAAGGDRADLDPDGHYAVITAVVTKDILPRRLPDEALLEATVARCKELRIPCDAALARKSIDSALFRYYRALRLERDLPADPRGIYHDHVRPKGQPPAAESYQPSLFINEIPSMDRGGVRRRATQEQERARESGDAIRQDLQQREPTVIRAGGATSCIDRRPRDAAPRARRKRGR
jgi:hypothetical protein